MPPDPGDPGQNTRGHLLLSLSTLNVAVVNAVGFGLLALAVAGLVMVLLSDRTPRLRDFLALMLDTYAFLAISLFTGQTVILNGANSTDLGNNRFGMSAILAVALMESCGVDLAARSLASRGHRWVTAAQWLGTHFGAAFTAALANPSRHARWIWLSEDPNDPVARAVAADQEFGAHYQLAYAVPGLRLYRRTV